jgi:hypothetical protein
MRPRIKAILKWCAIACVSIVVLIQIVPYGHGHENPPPVQEPRWASQEVRELAVRACFDCHSNETVWPWYSHVAPISWMVQNHVDEGRHELNFSEWHRPQEEADEAAEEIRDGEMPPRSYLLTHPEARLSSSEKELLAQGLEAMIGKHKDD